MKKLKKIVHLSHTDISCDSRILKEINCLSQDPSYELLSVGIAQSKSRVVFEPPAVDNKNLDIVLLKLRARNLTYFPKSIRHALTLIELFFKSFFLIKKFGPDIIHCHDTLVLPIGIILKSFRKETILIYDAHELESDKNGITRILSFLTYRFEKLVWSKIDHLITVSPSIGKWYEDNFGKKNSTVILNSPTTQSSIGLNFEEDNFREKLKIHKDEKIFIYVGILGEGRGIKNLLSVFKSLSSHIVFLGFGELESLVIETSKEHANIHYHEPVKHYEVVKKIKQADVGICLIENVSLSDYYCLPNKLFEYIFAGLPVIASNFPDIKELVEEYSLGICCQDNIEDIRRTIMEFESTDTIEKLEFEHLNELTWESQENKLKAIYEDLWDNGSLSKN